MILITSTRTSPREATGEGLELVVTIKTVWLSILEQLSSVWPTEQVISDELGDRPCGA